METPTLLVGLALFTLICVVLFAVISKRKVEARRHNPARPKSSLANDSPGKSAVEALDRR